MAGEKPGDAEFLDEVVMSSSLDIGDELEDIDLCARSSSCGRSVVSEWKRSSLSSDTFRPAEF